MSPVRPYYSHVYVITFPVLVFVTFRTSLPLPSTTSFKKDNSAVVLAPRWGLLDSPRAVCRT
ncbi:MAG: hypothetical protein ACFWUG_20375 [Rahnella inusitata]